VNITPVFGHGPGSPPRPQRTGDGPLSDTVDYPIGELVAERVKAMGVRGIYTRFAHDGVTGPSIATVYSDRGCSVRAPVVFYNRGNEAAARLKPGDVDWPAVFAGGARWFHSGGIFASLSPTTAELIVEGMQAARAQGAAISFDLNFREKLWKISGGQERAVSVLRRIVEQVDVLVGNEEDLQKGLGIPGPEVAMPHGGLDASSFVAMIERVLERYPRIEAIATTLREVHSTNHHS
jgi:2-dehydro-3-deoxygluconokinase